MSDSTQTSLPDDARAVIQFWFGDDPADTARVFEEKASAWFKGGDEIDRQCRERFGDAVAQASRGDLDAWAELPEGRLALVILLDQFRRNLYRNQPEMVELDPKAVALLVGGLENGHLEQLSVAERVFLLMPFMHSEDAAHQHEGVKRFEALATEVKGSDAPESVVKMVDNFADYARQHRDIVVRFGRFPHRNAFVSRDSTDEERAFLEQPGSSF